MAVFFNDQFLEDHKVLLHVSDLSMQRGYAIFDFFRTVNGFPLFLNDHLDRFYRSAEAMHMQVNKTKEELSVIVYELIKRSSIPEAGIRIMLTGGYSADSYHPAETNLIITCNPAKIAKEPDFEKGISVITHEHQRELPHIKSINYLMAVWLLPMLEEKRANDVLYYNKISITEFPRANVFMVTPDDILVTPAHNILHGITRKKTLSLAAGTMNVEERDITVDELLNASEIFLTSTTKKILPIIKVNDTMINGGKPGNITGELFQKFLTLETSAAHLVSR